MGRFSFRAGPNAEDGSNFTIIHPDRRDRVRRLVVTGDGTVHEEDVVIPGLRDEEES